ncbi:MAG: hypothetical protein WB579_16430 [Bryobacteraceae bacterium]
MDHQLARLLPFGRTRSFAPSPSSMGGIGMWRVERAGPDRWSRRQSLQSGNLVAQLPVLRPQLLDHPQQMIYQGRSFFRRHLDIGNLDRLGSIHAPQKTPKPPSG